VNPVISLNPLVSLTEPTEPIGLTDLTEPTETIGLADPIDPTESTDLTESTGLTESAGPNDLPLDTISVALTDPPLSMADFH